MEDIAININRIPSNDDSVSLDDPERKEVLWEPRLESLCNQWKSDFTNRSDQHDAKAKGYKRRYATFSIPAIILPLILSGFTTVLVDYPLVTSGLMALTSILTGINSFFNYGKKSAKHSEYACRFFKLSIEIDIELAKRKKDRIAADMYIERISNNYSNLLLSAPDI
jgi:hypothetical protein